MNIWRYGNRPEKQMCFEKTAEGARDIDWQEIVIKGAGEYILPGMGRMKIEIFEKSVHLDLTKKEYTKFADYDRIQNGITIRKYMEHDIIWAVGVRLSEKYKVRPDTKRVICLEYIPEGENEDERAD